MRKEYEPGTIIRRGQMTYEADCWGILRPVSQSAAYQEQRRRGHQARAAREDAELWKFREQMERIAQDRAFRENILPRMEGDVAPLQKVI